MPHRLGIRLVTAVVVAALAIAGYVIWIPIHRPDRHRVASLAVTAPVIGLRGQPQAVLADPVDAAPISSVKAAVVATRGETAAYAVDWEGVTPVTAGSVQLIVLPTTRYAREAQGQIVFSQLSQTSFTRSGYGFGGTTTVSGIPGATGAYYLKGSTPTVTASTPRVAQVIFRVDRVVVAATVEAKGAAATPTVRALASAEYHHLGKVGTDLVLAHTSYPLKASLLYGLVAVASLAVVELAPVVVTAPRRRRRMLRAAAQRRARTARGNQVVKRRAYRRATARTRGSRARHR